MGRPGHCDRGLIYALSLVNQVVGADQGTERMREVGAAIRQGANAYLGRQFRAIAPLMVVLTGLVWAAAESTQQVALGRAAAFFMGATFSWLVGFVGMSLAVRGNLRVAAAARTSYGAALQLGYRTGTITGMLTDGLGLLGGTLIFMAYGEHAYEVLLGFGFGGTLLALFMRVGGGIYTKAADVGADLVGKVEAGIPEDDPRNAATIADNVGDNVGDCAGMAADIFESYEVTIVAAMILGYASFGHKGVIFPLLVRAIGVLGSIWSTSTVKAGADSTSDEALHSVHHGFILGSIFSVVGFVVLGFFYLQFSPEYYKEYPQAAGGPGQWRPAVLGGLRHRLARHATGLDLLDRDRPGHHAQQGDQLLHSHPVRAGQVTGQSLPDRPCDQHYPGVCRRLRVGGGRHARHRGGHLALGPDLRRGRLRSSWLTAWRCAASVC